MIFFLIPFLKIAVEKSWLLLAVSVATSVTLSLDLVTFQTPLVT